MNSPYLNLPKRGRDEVRAEWREKLVQRQLAGLKAMGISEASLAREEVLLRGGAEVVELINHICGKPGALK